MNRWHVIYTKTGAENLARGQLEAQKFHVYFPQFAQNIRHARKDKRIIAPLFPRYIFVRFDPMRRRWRCINGTRGVSYLITMNEIPSALPEGIVEEIMARETKDHLINVSDQAPYINGDRLEITSGAFTKQVGAFLRMERQDRIVMLLKLLGKNIEVHLRSESVRAFA